MRSRTRSGFARVLVTLSIVTAAVMAVPSTATAEVDFTPVADNPWMANGEVRALVRHGDNLYVGGDFSGVRQSVDGPDVPPGRIAAFDAASGELISGFQPDIDATRMVKAMAMSKDGTKLFAGGNFAYVEGKIQRKLVALDPATGKRIDLYKPKVLGGGIEAMIVLPDGDLVIGGSFDSVNGQTRLGLARLSPGGALRAWNPAANSGKVWGFHLDKATNQLIVVGNFRNIDGIWRTKNIASLAWLNGDDSVDRDFPVQTPYVTREVEIVGNRLYAAIGGPGGRAEIYNVNTGSLLKSYRADGDVHAIEVVDDIVYFGGHWVRYIGSSNNTRFQGVRTDDLSLYYGFEPRVIGTVWEIEYDGDHIWLGGPIREARPVDKLGFTRYSVNTGDVNPPTVPGNLRTTEVTHNKVSLKWDASTDASGVDYYEVYEDGVLVKTTTKTKVNRYRLTPKTTYSYEVEAVDVLGNRSAAAELDVTTKAKPVVLVSKTSTWRYSNDGTDLGTEWRTPGYSHYSWAKAGGPFNSEGGEGTTIDSSSVTTYFRKKFTKSNLSDFSAVEFQLWRDDGVVVYLNGNEIWRNNMPDGTIVHGTRAASTIDGAAESERLSLILDLDEGDFIDGKNTLAVEVHQASMTPGDDLFFGMKLLGLD